MKLDPAYSEGINLAVEVSKQLPGHLLIPVSTDALETDPLSQQFHLNGFISANRAETDAHGMLHTNILEENNEYRTANRTSPFPGRTGFKGKR